jgi:hypothetical protein
MKPLINEGLLLNSRLMCNARHDHRPDYYHRYYLIKLCFFTRDESQRIIQHTHKQHSKN